MLWHVKWPGALLLKRYQDMPHILPVCAIQCMGVVSGPCLGFNRAGLCIVVPLARIVHASTTALVGANIMMGLNFVDNMTNNQANDGRLAPT
jgi:hypothetical protein